MEGFLVILIIGQLFGLGSVSEKYYFGSGYLLIKVYRLVQSFLQIANPPDKGLYC